jgi:hypothetical protein
MSNIECLEKINSMKKNISDYKTLYTKYLIDKKDIQKKKEENIELIRQKRVELEDSFLIKKKEPLSMLCDPKNNFKDCYLRCKELYNKNNRKPDVFVTTYCNDNNNEATCLCNYTDYDNLDKIIDEYNKLINEQVNILNIESKINKPDDVILDKNCCQGEIVCKDGECSDINYLCNNTEAFTTYDDNFKININHILILIVIIILIVFFLCK